MASKGKSKNEKSLCEISMEVVANVIRLSSFSIAQKTVGASTTGKAGKDHEKERLVPDQFPAASKRSQEPQSHANPTFMIKPVGGSGPTTTTTTTTQVIRKERVIQKERVNHKERVNQVKPKTEESVDGLASEYIHKIRNKLGCGL